MRGPALGTNFQTAGKDIFGIASKYEAQIKAYGIYDHGNDILGGNRGKKYWSNPFPPIYVPIEHPELARTHLRRSQCSRVARRLQRPGTGGRHQRSQFPGAVFPNDFMNGPNQESFLYVKQQNNIWAWTFLAEADFESWMTKTDWLPKVDGYVLGVKLVRLASPTTSTPAPAMASLRPTTVVPFAVLSDRPDATHRAL